MGISDANKTIMEKIKREHRQWVLEECLKRGMDLRQNFASWPYETRMYPAIKSITAAAPAEWGWDRLVTRDIIRTLCWDRVRSKNRRAKETNPNKHPGVYKKADPPEIPSAHDSKAKAKTKVKSKTKSKPKPDIDAEIVDSDTPLPLAKPPKTISRTKIPASAVRETSHPTPTPIKYLRKSVATSPVQPPSPYMDASSPLDQESQCAQRLPSLAPEDSDTFKVKLGRKIVLFARDIDYEEFDNEIQNMLTIEEDEMRCYRSVRGSKQDTEWKPLGYAIEFTKMLEMYADVGIEVGVQSKVQSCFLLRLVLITLTF